MSKRLVMFCVAVLALALAIPVYAEVQNVKVSGDLNVVALSRYNFALGSTDVNSGGYQNALASIARLRVDAELTDNVSVVLRLLNERVWDNELTGVTTGAATGSVTAHTHAVNDANTEIDLDLAYMVLKEFLYSPLTLTAGRQELHFGNDLIIGDPDTNGAASGASSFGGGGTLTDIADLSARKAFDAVRGTLNYIFADQPLTVDLVYAKIDENTNNRDDDVNLYGANANYPVNDDILTEVYFWTRERRPGSLAGVTDTVEPVFSQGIEAETLHTIGTRGVYTGVDNLTLQGEYAIQIGDKYMDSTANPNLETAAQSSTNALGLRVEDDLVDVTAWGLQLIASYVLENVRHDPVLGISYTHLSGENEPYCSGPYGDWNAWDAMYENQGGGTIWNKIMGFSNCDLLNVNANVKPDFVDDLTVLANWYHIRLVEDLGTGSTAANTFLLSGIPGGQTYSMTADKHLGDEIDLDLIYDYTEDVQLGLSLGWFVPGDAFNAVNKNTATQAIASMKVTF